MDRQARYRSLLPTGQFTILAALDCPTLARLLRTRPVDVVLFDLQTPAMPAGEWLNMISQDAELRCVPIIWVGRDVPQEIYQRVCQTPNSELIPAQPNSEMVVEILRQQQQVAAKVRREFSAETQQEEDSSWQPEENIINDALSIFEQEGNGQAAPRQQYEEEWTVDEVSVGSTPQVDESLRGLDVVPQETGAESGSPIGEESSPNLDIEEIGTGKFGVVVDEQQGNTTGVVHEKLMNTTTNSGEHRSLKNLVDQVTDEVIASLTGRLVEALVSKIDRAMIREIVEIRLQEKKTPQSS